MSDKVKVGDYLVIGVPGDWRVMEQFGAHRMLKKKFRTLDAAKARAEQMGASR